MLRFDVSYIMEPLNEWYSIFFVIYGHVKVGKRVIMRGGSPYI